MVFCLWTESLLRDELIEMHMGNIIIQIVDTAQMCFYIFICVDFLGIYFSHHAWPLVPTSLDTHHTLCTIVVPPSSSLMHPIFDVSPYHLLLNGAPCASKT